MGRTTTRTSSTPLIGLNHVKRKLVHHLALQKGPNQLDHQLDKQWDPAQSLDHQLSSSDPDLCPRSCLNLAIIALLVGYPFYLLKKMGRDLSLMEYLKYSFDTGKIEDGFSNSKSIKLWDPGEKPLQPPLFRKESTATYGYEFVAAKTATEQFMDLKYTLRYPDVPIKPKSYISGDNRSIGTHTTLLNSMLKKHWELTKIFPMIQKLLMTCGLIILIQRSATKETPKSSS